LKDSPGNFGGRKMENAKFREMIVVETIILGEDKSTIQNKKANDTTRFYLEFQSLPRLGDPVIINDGDAKGEYVVAEPIVHEITENKSHPIMILKWQCLPNEIRIGIDN
jgi:hypothetical protein